MSDENKASELDSPMKAVADLDLTQPSQMKDDGGDDDDGGDGDGDGKEKTASRRFFPRVKQLINPEWEHFLQEVLHSVQTHQAHTCLKASGVEDNAWYQVFHSVYGGIASESCSIPQGKNRYHKFKDKIVELWRYMAVTDAPDHDTNGRLWKLGRAQWEMYKSLLVVAGKQPMEITLDAKGSPTKPRKKGKNKIPALGGGVRMVSYEPAPKKPKLPSPLEELHNCWKMSVKHDDTDTGKEELDIIRKDYQKHIQTFAEDCTGGPDNSANLSWYLEGLNELREAKQDDDIKKLITDTYKAVLQRYVMVVTTPGGGGKKRARKS